MNWFKSLIGKVSKEESDVIECVTKVMPNQKPAVKEKEITQEEREEAFEQIWVEEQSSRRHNRRRPSRYDLLSDKDYIDYNIWEKEHSIRLYNKHCPEVAVIRGFNPNVVFHGGCLGCVSQKEHGIQRCTGCQYFRANWDKPDLSKGTN